VESNAKFTPFIPNHSRDSFPDTTKNTLYNKADKKS